MAILHCDKPINIERCYSQKLTLKMPGETYITGNKFNAIHYCGICGYWEIAELVNGSYQPIRYVKH